MNNTDRLIDSLRRDAKRMNDGELKIGIDFDEMDFLITGAERSGLLATALGFWDSWVDCSNHEWKYYDGIERHDWARLALVIADCLESNTNLPSNTTEQLSKAGIPV